MRHTNTSECRFLVKNIVDRKPCVSPKCKYRAAKDLKYKVGKAIAYNSKNDPLKRKNYV